MNMEEIWKDVVGYEGLYQVSNWGRIKSLDCKRKCFRGYRFYQGKILTQRNMDGYWFVSLHRNRKPHNYAVHRLVAMAFIPNPNNLPQVGHKDEKNLNNSNECNNNVKNLEWTTSKLNNNQPQRIARVKEALAKKENRTPPPKSKEGLKRISEATSKPVYCDGLVFKSITDCANYYNICYVTLSKVLRGKTSAPKKWHIKEIYFIKR